MKNLKKFLVIGLALIMSLGIMAMVTGCGESGDAEQTPVSEEEDAAVAEEAVAACNAAIEAIQVQERTDETDAQCEAAKAAYDALTDEQKEQLDDPDYFGLDTGDASKDDPLNGDDIGENELLVVSFGTSFNDSRAEDIGGVEKALARDGEKIDNTQQALERAVANEVKNLVIQPTHLMHGAEYDELMGYVNEYKDKFDSIEVAEPLLGEVGKDASEVNADKEATAKAAVAEAVKAADADSIDALAEDGTAIVCMGHGTGHEANVTYDEMQTQMDQLGYKNVFVGTVEGNPPDTALPEVKKAVEDAGYTKVILRPLMVVAGDHANNDMAADEEGTWYYGFVNGGQFEVEGADAPVEIGEGLGADNVTCQIEGLGRIADIQKIYIDHTGAVIK